MSTQQTLNTEVVDTLKELIKTSEDGQKGFAEGADIVTDAQLKSLMTLSSNDCATAVRELQQIAQQHGVMLEEKGSAVGALHRGWVKVKSSIEDKNLAVLEEVERGQDHAKAAYMKALKVALPADIKTLIDRQAAGAKRNHDRIRDLRNSYKAEA